MNDLVIPTENLLELSLFSGALGGVLGTKYVLGWRTLCYIEWDAYAIEIIKARIRDGLIDDAPIWNDVRSFTKRNNQTRRFIRQLRRLRRRLVISAGFPCQPFSTAGKQLAENDPRNGWPHTARIIREIRPRYVFLENVPGLVSSGYIFTVIRDLVDCAYTVEPPFYLAASDVGANHQRERVWIVAHANCDRSPARCSNQAKWKKGEVAELVHDSASLAYASCPRWRENGQG